MSPAKKTTTKNTSAHGVAKKAAAAVKKAVTKATGGATAAKKKPTPAKPTATKATPKRTAAKKTTSKSNAAKKTTAKPTALKKTPAKKTTAKPTAAKKTTATKTTAKSTAAKKTTAKKTTAKKTTAKKTTAKKTTAKPNAVKKTASKKTAAGPTTGGRPAAPKTTAPKTAKKPAAKDASGTRGIRGSKAKETATTPGAPLASNPAKTPHRMPKQNIQALPPRKQPPPIKTKRRVKPANLDKTALAAIKKQLQDDMAEYEQQLKDLDTESFTSNQTDVSGERAGMGEDFADAGTATFDRERDLSIRNNVLDLMDQVTRALQRIEEGTYGSCESCGNPIDADRIKAFPRSLMCIDCKRREERIR